MDIDGFTSQDVSIVISGEAGQGLNTIELIFMTLLKRSGYFAFLSKEFMSRVRGGNNTSAIRVSATQPSAFIDRIDILVVLAPNSIARLEKRLSPKTIILGEAKNIPAKYAAAGLKVFPLEMASVLARIGGNIYANSFILGLLSGLLSCNPDIASDLLKTHFANKGIDIAHNNLNAFLAGMDSSKAIPMQHSIKPDPAINTLLVMSGTDAIGLGAIAGGCNFIASYPMSPGTGVLAYLAKKSQKAGIIVEQAEDEIAAINMMLGAWYAGARGMVTTSGGGFDLMTEGLSLAGCVESPAVINLAQRPGPATGLPTRTEQGDLNLALYGGHGEFPRVIYAPGNLKDAILLTQKAFNVADQYQVPVFLLTDQYFLDSMGMMEDIPFSDPMNQNYFIKTGSDYKRYDLTPSGISPRGIPGYGDGLVCVDSDEHTVDGRITEDFEVRVSMVDKRMRKLEKFIDTDPELFGKQDFSILIIGWGSTYGIIREAILQINKPEIAFVYFKQVYPLPKSSKKMLEKATVRIVVENNITGQFAKFLESETLLKINHKILKYNGMPFSVEELVHNLTEVLS